jgi:hypothetical protein
MFTLTHVGQDYIEVQNENGEVIELPLRVAELFLDGKIAIDPLIDKKELEKYLEQ